MLRLAPPQGRPDVACAVSPGAELFLFLTVWCLAVVLPTNLSVRARAVCTEALAAGQCFVPPVGSCASCAGECSRACEPCKACL